MVEINEVILLHGNAVREAAAKFFFPLQTTRVIKLEAFEELSGATKALANALRGHELVPKSLLSEIYLSIQILKNEAPYFRDETATLESMANQLEMTFGLILINESHDDRTPGVPRIL